jgi:hypothetical protein
MIMSDLEQWTDFLLHDILFNLILHGIIMIVIFCNANEDLGRKVFVVFHTGRFSSDTVVTNKYENKFE